MTERFNKVKSTKETIHYNGIEDTEKEVIYNYGKQDDFLEDITQLLNELNDENEELNKSRDELIYENRHIKKTIQTMLINERTAIGKSVLKQLWDAINME